MKYLMMVGLAGMLVAGCHRNTRDDVGDKAEAAGDKIEDSAENAADKTGDAAERAGDKVEDATDK